MTLKIYRKKRNFANTKEPKGKNKKKLSSTKKLYVIQKHNARHLHYDFRLELNGVLLSWAIPKEPSLDPAIKRLAVHVEDHPLEYGLFEGEIPRGQYGAGKVTLWDKGEWICENENPNKSYHSGNLTFELRGKKLKGKWKLIRINKNDKTWLLMKLEDSFAKKENIIEDKSLSHDKKIFNIDLPESPFPNQISPQLAVLVDSPPTGKNWLHEIKFDGYRLLIFKKGKKVTIYTRNKNDWTKKFKILAEEIKKFPINNFIIDGEAVVLDKKSISNFQMLQNSIKNKSNDIIFYAFDLLYLEHYNLMSLKLIERKNLLKKILSSLKSKVIYYNEYILGSGKKIFNKTCQLGLEGIVSKKIDSPYHQKRDSSWLKCKCIKRQEFVIGGLVKSTSKNQFKSLMVGTFNRKKELIYHGNVGSGVHNNLYNVLLKYQTEKNPFKNGPKNKNSLWLRPVIIAEVEFSDWTQNEKIRHASFKGIRSDKKSHQIIKENSVTEYKLTHPDKILYPENKITKRDIANYYETIHEWILPYISNRPLSVFRCQKNYLEGFFQKHLKIKNSSGIHHENNYFYIDNQEGLMSLIQLGVLEIHMTGSTLNHIKSPDILTFDLDPSPHIIWKKVVNAAFEIKKIFKELNLKSYVKTTGGKGLHVVIPIKPDSLWTDIKLFSHTLTNYLVKINPELYTSNSKISLRKNKIFIDYLRNQKSATSIAPYSTRARRGATVALPIDWDELTNNIRDTSFTIKDVPKRLSTLKHDPWEDFFLLKQALNLKKLIL